MMDVLRSRMVLGFMIFLMLITSAMGLLSADSNKAVTGLMHIVLMIVPVFSIIAATIHYYNSREFIELLLSQPLRRQQVFFAEYFGITFSISAAILIGLGLPALIFQMPMLMLWLLLLGTGLAWIFCALAFLASVATNDKARGIGWALLLWFFFAILYDGIVLILLYNFSDYPLEKPMLVLTALNPIDLSRILLLFQTDMSALMGFTGAVFKEYLGSSGTWIAIGCLVCWWALPFVFAMGIWRKKDL